MPIKSLSHFINPMKRVHQHEGIVDPELAKQAEQTQKRISEPTDEWLWQ